MKTLKFEGKLAQLILSGEKDVTWRIFDNKNLSAGDEITLINSDSMTEFGKGKIISVREKKFKDLDDVDLAGHEKFETREKMLETYRRYYGDTVTVDTFVKIVKFKLL